jgi:hypothetical protein
MCGSVTVAISKQQTCHCGGQGPQAAVSIPSPMASVPGSNSETILSDPMSPTKTTFKVQKSSRPPSQGRKQSFDPSNFARMDMNSVNIHTFKAQQDVQHMQPNIAIPEGYTMVSQPPMYGYGTQYAVAPAQFSHLPMPLPPMPLNPPSPMAAINGFSNGQVYPRDPYVVDNSMDSPTMYANGGTNSHLVEKLNGTNGLTNGGSCCTPSSLSGANENPIPPAPMPMKKSSCCAPAERTSNNAPASHVVLPEMNGEKPAGCCSSKRAPPLKQELSGTPLPSSAPNLPHTMGPTGMPFVQAYYPQYVAHDPTVITYPSTYGSFQHPLQPAAWKESMRTNNYSPHPMMPMAGPSAYQETMPHTAMNTIHECACGDGCQCIGCAAHPYNEPTRDYVRSAWQMSMNQSSGDAYTNGQQPTTPITNGQGHGIGLVQNGDLVASPSANSDATSGTGDEQNLPAENFLFVNYPLYDNCAGDMTTCPCGDDCACIGCKIHRSPITDCRGTEDTCQCGDDCECLGCIIHNPQISS